MKLIEVSGREVVEYMARVRKQEATVVNVRLPEWMVNRLDGRCAVMLLSRSDVIRMALREYLGEHQVDANSNANTNSV